MMRTDNDIQTDVLDEFVWDPEVDAPEVEDGSAAPVDAAVARHGRVVVRTPLTI